mmetsp:Transcript_10474/g.27174  ORF Transcript_10474/g.27174 Transcript_10474/m.27174 type:complete len:102 (+) Transcript_10474:44-349(+)
MNNQPKSQVAKTAQLASECAHMLANEPALGAYYVMEHVERSVPAIVDCKRMLQEQQRALQGASTDAAFDSEAVHLAGSQEVSDSLTRIRAELARQSAQCLR